jgi:hypothetical protein
MFGHDTIDSKLGEHLVILYWRGALDRELVETYFARADDELAADLMTFVGHALRNTPGDAPASILERLQGLWEWRASTTIEDPNHHELELRAFGTWFASAKFDSEWATSTLDNIVELVGAPTHGHLVAIRLAEAAQLNPIAAVRIFSRMLKRQENEWDYVGWRDEARAILQAALDSNEDEAAEHLAAAVDFYVQHGELQFRDLISRTRT